MTTKETLSRPLEYSDPMDKLTIAEQDPPDAITEIGKDCAAVTATEVYAAPTVGDVLMGLIRHPVEHLIHRWNWKSAVLSSSIRGTAFFFTNLVAGWHAALGAMLAELALRSVTSGFYGAITEAFSAARPVWAGAVAAMVVLPILNHSLEFLVHWLRGTPKLGISIGASVFMTVFSTLFSLFAMRKGVLTVGGESKSLGHDLKRVLPLLLQFFAAGPRAILRRLRRDSSPK